MTNNKNSIVCPTCGMENTWHKDNPARPFCSERCKLIDLGSWADDSRRIPGEDLPLNNEEDEE